jgi:signal transduction histidine kinase
MFSRSRGRVFRTIHVKLTFFTSLVIITGFVFLFGFTYFFFSSTLEKEIHEDLRYRLLQYWAAYKTGGVDFIRDEVEMERTIAGGESIFVRVADPSNKTLFSDFPREWEAFGIEETDPESLGGDGKPVTVKSENLGFSVILLGFALEEGSYLQVGMSTAENQRILRRFSEVMLFALVPLALIAILAGLLITSRLLKPIHRLISTVQSIADTGDTRVRVPVEDTGDELDTLGRLFNEMLGRIEGLLEGMRGTLDNVAHDLRTPLTRIILSAGVVLEGESEAGGCREEMARIYDQAKQLQATLNSILDIREAETGVIRLEIEATDLGLLIEDVAELYRYVAEDRAVSLETELVPGCTAELDRNRIRQVVANLLDNAVKYTEAGGRVLVRLFCGDKEADIRVVDTGSGIEEQDLSLIWDRLYRGSRQRNRGGLGLGLSTVKAIVEAHGGRVEVKSRIGEGSEFRVILSKKFRASSVKGALSGEGPVPSP